MFHSEAQQIMPEAIKLMQRGHFIVQRKLRAAALPFTQHRPNALQHAGCDSGPDQGASGLVAWDTHALPSPEAVASRLVQQAAYFAEDLVEDQVIFNCLFGANASYLPVGNNWLSKALGGNAGGYCAACLTESNSCSLANKSPGNVNLALYKALHHEVEQMYSSA